MVGLTSYFRSASRTRLIASRRRCPFAACVRMPTGGHEARAVIPRHDLRVGQTGLGQKREREMHFRPETKRSAQSTTKRKQAFLPNHGLRFSGNSSAFSAVTMWRAKDAQNKAGRLTVRAQCSRICNPIKP